MYSKDTHDFDISVHKISEKMKNEIESGRFRVVIFGSARIKESDDMYQKVYNLAKKIGEAGHDIITGGGPGIMEAANKGHRDGTPAGDDQSKSIGLNIRLPMEQHANPNLDIEENHDRFSTRLDEFMMLSNIVVVADGGIGTLLELFYTWQLTQVRHVCRMPIILMGEMWKGLIDWIKKEPLARGYLSPEDLDFIIHVDSCDEAYEVIDQTYQIHLEHGDKVCLNSKIYLENQFAKQ